MNDLVGANAVKGAFLDGRFDDVLVRVVEVQDPLWGGLEVRLLAESHNDEACFSIGHWRAQRTIPHQSSAGPASDRARPLPDVLVPARGANRRSSGAHALDDPAVVFVGDDGFAALDEGRPILRVRARGIKLT